MKLLTYLLYLFRRSLLQAPLSAVQYLGHRLLVFPDSCDKRAPVIAEPCDLCCRCESMVVQCVFVWRHRQKQPEGSYKKLAVLLGTVQQLKTAEAAWRKAELDPLYASSEAGFNEQVRLGALCNRYIEHAIPSRHSTRKSYMTILNKHILPRWQYTPLVEVRAMFVQDWLDQVPLAPKTKGKIKALMYGLFEKRCSGS